MNDAAVTIGNQTSFTAPTATYPFEFAVEHGFSAFEWFPDRCDGRGFDEHDLSDEHRRDLRNLAIGSKIRQSVHAPWWIDLADSESQERMASIRDFAVDMGAALIVVHLMLDHGIDAFVDGAIAQLEALAPQGVQLAIENTVRTGPKQFVEVFDILRAREPELAKAAGVCFDMGHANLYQPTHNDYLGWLDELPQAVPLIHMHVHENWGDADSHLTLFTGPASLDTTGIDGLIERIVRRGFKGSLILEQWPSPPDLLTAATVRLRGMLDRHKPAAAEQLVFGKQNKKQ